MTRIQTVCPRDCPDTCFMEVEVQEGSIVSIQGSRENPITAGFLCARGQADARRMQSPGRLLAPEMRVEKCLDRERVSWDAALDEVAGRLRDTLDRHGPDRVLFLDYAGNTGLLTSVFPRRLWNVIGAARTDHSICTRSGHAALELHFGSSLGLDVESLPSKKLILFWGHNGLVSSPHLYRLATLARREGAVLVAIDPRRSETASQADLHLAPRPGSDAALAWGIARALIERGAVDMDFLARFSLGIEEYRERALSWEPSQVQAVTGLPWEQIQELAALLDQHRPSAWMLGIGFQKRRDGAESVRAVSLLPSLLGEHRAFYYTNSRGRLVDFGAISGDSTLAGTPRVVSQVSVGDLLASGEFKFVYVFCMNPAVSLPGADAVRRGFSRDDVFVVVHDTHRNETTALADVVLPATTFLEKDDLVVSDSHPWVRKACRAVEPLGQAMGEVELMQRLGRRLGLTTPELYQDPWEALREATQGAFEEGSFEGLMRGEVGRWAELARDQYPTPSGRIEFRASRCPQGIDPLPSQGAMAADDGAFTLLTSAPASYTNSQFQDVFGPLPSEVWVHPADAATLGLKDGGRAVLESGSARIEVLTRVTERTQRGVLWMTRPLNDPSGRPQNALIPQETQALGGGSVYNSARVRLRAVGE